jgi:type IV pilus assembly protein PilB
MSFYKDSDLYKTTKELGIIPEEALDVAFKESSDKKLSLAHVLVDRDLISDENLGKIIADLVSVDFVRLSGVSIEKDILNTIPEVYAKKQKVIAFKKDKEGLHLAMIDPSNSQAKAFIEKKSGVIVIPYFATERDIENAFTLYAKDVKKAFSEIIEEGIREATGVTKPEPSIIKIVDTIITYAYQNKSSDIHIEPIDETSLIRFRIDGLLHDIVELPIDLHIQVVTRVKVLASLRTDEHQAAQDGKIAYELSNEKLDMRVSIVPITDGEKVVMRLLSERSRQFSLVDLGFTHEDLKKVELAYKEPHGMILATGPTGSGKTTTLYSILKLVNRREVNIMTIEDPVEYDIEGVNQIQVNPKTDLTFAKGLRSIVRQDPDIMLVGEIRDEETADISINAAMTGHLVLSTLHTNDAATTIPRLMDMKVEPFLIATTLNLIVAQRLVRKICDQCRVSKEVDVKLNIKSKKSRSTSSLKGLSADLIGKYFGEGTKTRIYEGKGCSVCHGTGYAGRVGIFEILIIDEKIRKAIVERKDAAVIKEIAVKGGMVTMIENGFEKIKQGITTIEEILRVVKE